MSSLTTTTTKKRLFATVTTCRRRHYSFVHHAPLIDQQQQQPYCANVDVDDHFYRNKILDEYVQQRTTPITLRQLLFYERHMNTERLLISANYVRKELPIRISHRIREFQKLPFIVGTNPHIQQVYDLYWRAFERLRKVPPIKTLADNDAYCKTLVESLEQHLVVIPRLALGISECGEHMGSDRIDRFMQATLRSRISRRVLAEQHLALSQQYHHRQHDHHAARTISSIRSHQVMDDNNNVVGGSAAAAVFSSCSARDTVAQCASLLAQKYSFSPTLELDGDEHVVFTYHSDHIKYIIYQLLSNAFRHTIQAHQHTSSSSSSSLLPPIRVTICSNENDVLFRISDQGGGIPSDVYRHIWSYGHLPRFNTLRTLPQLAARIAELKNDQFIGAPPLGIGLPMSRVYAEYWGGDMNVVSMPGWGTDAYVRIPRFGTQNENLDICSPYDNEDQRPIHLPHSPPRRLVV